MQLYKRGDEFSVLVSTENYKDTIYYREKLTYGGRDFATRGTA